MTGFAASLLEPFIEFPFMRRALVATLALSLGCAPIGCVLVLRRMSLVGDAMAHAVLPGAAAGFLLAGLSLPAMSAGGFVAALAVALAAGFVTRSTPQREDASFAAFYLIALALGVLLVSLRGSQIDLMHMRFGSVLAMAALSVAIGAVSGAAGLLLSYHAELPSGPCIVLVCGGAYIASVLFGARDGIVTRRLLAASHLTR